MGVGVTGWVASRREPVVIAEHKELDPRYVPIPALRGSDYVSMASVPMASKAAGLHIEWHEFAKAHTIAGLAEIEVIQEFVKRGYQA